MQRTTHTSSQIIMNKRSVISLHLIFLKSVTNQMLSVLHLPKILSQLHLPHIICYLEYIFGTVAAILIWDSPETTLISVTPAMQLESLVHLAELKPWVLCYLSLHLQYISCNLRYICNSCYFSHTCYISAVGYIDHSYYLRYICYSCNVWNTCYTSAVI